MQRQFRIGAVAQRVKQSQCSDTAFEYTVAALRIHIFRGVTRHRSNDFDLSVSEKSSQIIVTVFEQDGEIAAIYHVAWRLELSYSLNEVAKIGNHFGRPARQIDGGNIGLRQPIDNPIDCLA